MKNKITIGSRESKLAVLQSEMVRDYITEHNPDLTVEILTMKTTGDKILDRTLDKVGGKGLFVKELDHALLEGRSELSVHSLKDMPMEVPAELPLLAFSRREDPRDVLVLPEGVTELDRSKPLGCSSLRRTLQLRELYPDMEVASVRGNLQTRLRKLDEGQYSALILRRQDLRDLDWNPESAGILQRKKCSRQQVRESWQYRDVPMLTMHFWTATVMQMHGAQEVQSVLLYVFWTAAVLLRWAAFGVVEGEELSFADCIIMKKQETGSRTASAESARTQRYLASRLQNK